jgi:hypothetical protein
MAATLAVEGGSDGDDEDGAQRRSHPERRRGRGVRLPDVGLDKLQSGDGLLADHHVVDVVQLIHGGAEGQFSESDHKRTARGGHGLLKVSPCLPGHALPFYALRASHP